MFLSARIGDSLPFPVICVFASDGLLKTTAQDVCMESTGKYWIPIGKIPDSIRKIVSAHPKQFKAIRGKKTDNKDAERITDFFKHDLVSESDIVSSNRFVYYIRIELLSFAVIAGFTRISL